MRKRRTVTALVISATLATGGLVGLGAAPAAAAPRCTDTISVGPPVKSGGNVKARSSICAPGNWRGRAWIERWRGFYWDTLDRSQRRIQGSGMKVARQYPLSASCAGAGTYTYRGGIWASNTLVTYEEHSAKRRFRC
jgi:hypothetical protein